MKRALQIQEEYNQIGTIGDLASVFESIASMHIAQIKDKVVISTKFFNELWHIYSQLRIDDKDKHTISRAKSGRVALVAITSEGGLTGDIDERIIKAMLEHPREANTDIILLGAHGATLLRQKGIQPTKTFPLPDVEQASTINPIIQLMKEYEHAKVFYQTYVTLLKQEVASIDLFSTVEGLGHGAQQTAQGEEIISDRDYIFEPSLPEIITYLESIMLEIALGQVVLESRLAQYASRFNAMSSAKDKSLDLRHDLAKQLNRAKRAQSDERGKETLASLRQQGRQYG